MEPEDFVYYVRCHKCASFANSVQKMHQKVGCSGCSTELVPKETNLLVYLGVEKQLKQILRHYWPEIVKFRAECLKVSKDVIKDVASGNILKNVLLKNVDCHALSLTMNSDGVSILKSNSDSLWPIQFTLSFLPPELRYKQSNIIVAAAYYGKLDMPFLDLFTPLAEEFEKLQSSGFLMVLNQKVQHFKVCITMATVDLQAKAKIQRINACIGYNACTYCHRPGNPVKNEKKKSVKPVVRYTKRTPNDCMRTHNGTVLIMNKIEMEKSSNVKPAKKPQKPEDDPNKDIHELTCMIAFDNFDMIYSFAIDYMHCVLIGVLLKMCDLWLNSKMSNDYRMKNKNISELNNRISALQPLSKVSRMPRSTEHLNDFKANEHRGILLFYLRVCLPGLLDINTSIIFNCWRHRFIVY